MVKVILIFPVFLAYFFPITSGKNLPNEIKGWSLHRTDDARYLPQREDSASEKVHEAKLTQENWPGSTSRTYYARKLFRLTHRSANPEISLKVHKVEARSNIINNAKEISGKGRVKREEEPYVKWTEPPPAWISETNEVRTVDVQMLKGSTQVPLKWNYVLSPGLVLKATKFSVVRYLTFLEEIGGLQYREDGSSHVFINEGYQTHYNISTSEVATLILNNVTEREETTFQCKLYTVPHGEWVYKIRVKLTEFSLLYAINNNPFTEIHKISLEDGIHTDGTALVSWRRVGDFIGLDYDYQQNRLYWADSFSIYRSFLGNGIETIHSNLPSVTGLAVDWLGDNIYWTDEYGIKVSRTDGRFVKTLVNHPDYTGIVLDPARGYMYWIHWGVTSTDIMSAHMSHVGGERLAIQVFEPRGMAIDYSDQSPARTLFWTDRLYGKGAAIRKTDLVQSQTLTVKYTPHPRSISVFEEILYWDDWSTRSIYKANISHITLHNSWDRQNISSRVIYPLDIKVLHRNMQRGHNLCSQFKPCTHLCLADRKDGFQCACPDNMKTVRGANGKVTCLRQDDELGDTTELTPPQSKKWPPSSTSLQSSKPPLPTPGETIVYRIPNSKHDRPYWAIGVAVACVILILIVVYLVRRKKRLEQSQSPAFVVFKDEKPASHEEQPSSGGQSSHEGQM